MVLDNQFSHAPRLLNSGRVGIHETPTILTWTKDRIGNGHWLRGQTEHCILAVRGNPTTTPGEKLTGAAND
jgi:hypothetical protein